MKIALVNLPNEEEIVRRFRCNVFTQNYLLPPIQLLSMASLPEDVVFIDSIADGMDKEKFSKAIENHDPDLLLFLAGFETLEKEIDFVQKFRKKEIKVGCFGHLPSLFPKKVLRKGLDFVITGWPETALKKIIKKKKEKIKGIYKGRKTKMDNLPIPRYEFLSKNYNDIFLPKPFAAIETSRGCPYNCIYCTKPFGDKVRRKSVKRVIKELKTLKNFGFKYIRFLDDLFTSDKKWVKKLCKKIIKENLEMKFVCLTRPDTIDKKMLDLMKKAGFVRLLVGVESGSDKMLNYYKRGYDKKTLKKKLETIKKSGIETIGWFIVSSKDDEKGIQESLNMAEFLDWVVVSVLEPRPGTKLFKKSKKKFQLFPYKIEFSSRKNVEKQKKLERDFLFQYYTRPKNVLKIIKMGLKYPKQIFSLFFRTLKYIIFLESGPRPDVF